MAGFQAFDRGRISAFANTFTEDGKAHDRAKTVSGFTVASPSWNPDVRRGTRHA